MKDVLVDTNVLLDVLAGREPFYPHSAAIWVLAERGRIKAHVSVVSFTNLFYIIRKLRGRDVAQQALRKMRDVFNPIALDAQLLNQAMDSGFADFEDAIQYFSAIRADATRIISRNPDHFPASSTVVVLSPLEFLAAWVDGVPE
ncbi:MAG: PIN domain-containing protein [Planctomycetes bacterium]|nr:PIN domain-containing protein [Planctomycetota bacterium]